MLFISSRPQCVNTSGKDDPYMVQPENLIHPEMVTHTCFNELSQLVHVMACRLFCTTPLPKLMLIYCHLDPWNKLLWRSSVRSKECIWKYFFFKFRSFGSGHNVLIGICLARPLDQLSCIRWLQMWVVWFCFVSSLVVNQFKFYIRDQLTAFELSSNSN